MKKRVISVNSWILILLGPMLWVWFTIYIVSDKLQHHLMGWFDVGVGSLFVGCPCAAWAIFIFMSFRWWPKKMSETYISGHPLDQCRCGDYRRAHIGGTGKCTVCLNCNPHFVPRCQAFNLLEPATQEDVLRFQKMGINYPEVKTT